MKDEIKKFFRGDVEDSDEVIEKYSHDASVFEVRPQLVLYPRDKEDVKKLVEWVRDHKNKYADPEKNKDWANLSITARCAGTDMSGGAIGESLILDFTRYMNRLISFRGNHITVEPGMFYRDFEKITLEQGLILPCYTASKSLNAVGGMFGNNSAGERTLKYGKTEDYIMETKVVFADGEEHIVRPLNHSELEKKIREQNFEGEVYKNIFQLINLNKEEIDRAKPRVHKNSAGYYLWNVIDSERARRSEEWLDLNKLLVGSQGTLGIATEITFRLVPQTKNSKLVVIFLKDLEPLGRLVDEILSFKPETLESYDDKTMKFAVRFFYSFLKNRGFFGAIRFMWSFMPEMLMMLHGFPRMILLAEFAGKSYEEVDDMAQKLERQIRNFNLKVHITRDSSESEKYWQIRRDSFSLLRRRVSGLHTAPFIDDIIVRPELLPKFLPELQQILKGYTLVYTIAGHAGDGNFHIIPLMDFSRPDTGKIILELSEKVYDLVLKYKGSITAEHNDGLIRTPYLKKMYGEKITELFAEVKRIFDPTNIFNPGKKVPLPDGPGSKEYISSHLAIEPKAHHGS